MFRTATTKHAKQMTNLTLWQKVKIFIKFKKPAKKIPVHKKDAFFGLMERDTFDKIRDFGLFCLEMFKVFMATLLSLFVPQLCGPTLEDPTKHVCSIDENTRDLSPWNTFVLAFNFCTLGFALLHYLIVWKREQLFIDYLDEDDDFPDNHLPRVLELYPEIKHDLHLINWTVFVSSIFVMMLFVVNMIVSGVLVFRDYYHSFQTVTVYLTNTALIITVIEKTLFHAWAGIQHKVALSCFVFEPISFNVIDAEYVDRDLEARHFGPDLLKKKSSVAGDIPTEHNSGGLADVHLHDEHPAAQAPVLASSQQRSDDNITVHVDPSGHPDLPPTH